MSALVSLAGDLLTRVRERRPRIHCLTNSVVQKFTADGLTALGAIPSMTQSHDEVAEFAAKADALLVNLGTLDPARREAIALALDAFSPTGRPWALDPVHCEVSSLRLDFARSLLALGPSVVRGNAAEMAVIGEAPAGTVRVTTGAVDGLVLDARSIEVANGHPTMAKVTGTGCLAGAFVASFLVVGDGRLESAAAALAVYGVCAEIAAETARGPGSFAVALLDAIGNVTPGDVARRGRVRDAAG